MKIRDIKPGYKFCIEQDLKNPGKLYEIVSIKPNKNAENPCKDMWGNIVWEEHAYTVKYKDLETGSIDSFVVQTQDSKLDWIITPCKTKEEAMELSYKYFKKMFYKHLESKVKEMFEQFPFNNVNKFPELIEKDIDFQETLKTLESLF